MKTIGKTWLSLLSFAVLLSFNACFLGGNNFESSSSSEGLRSPSESSIEESSAEELIESESSTEESSAEELIESESSTEESSAEELIESESSIEESSAEELIESESSIVESSAEEESASLGTGTLTGNGVELPDVPLG